jgi:hypothetical protein
LRKKLKSIWIKNSMGDGLPLWEEILDWMLRIRKARFCRHPKAHCKLLFLDALTDIFLYWIKFRNIMKIHFPEEIFCSLKLSFDASMALLLTRLMNFFFPSFDLPFTNASLPFFIEGVFYW